MESCDPEISHKPMTCAKQVLRSTVSYIQSSRRKKKRGTESMGQSQQEANKGMLPSGETQDVSSPSQAKHTAALGLSAVSSGGKAKFPGTKT